MSPCRRVVKRAFHIYTEEVDFLSKEYLYEPRTGDWIDSQGLAFPVPVDVQKRSWRKV